MVLNAILNISTSVFLSNVISIIEEAERRNPSNIGEEIKKSTDRIVGFLLCILAINLIYPVVNIYLNWITYRLGMRVKSSFLAMIVDKIMRVSTMNSTKYNEGTLLNYIQVDIDRIENCLSQLLVILTSLTSIIIGLAMIYYFIGVVVFYIILATVLMNIFYCLVYAWRTAVAKKLLSAKDLRLSYLKSVLKNLEYVKLSALEDYYWKQINALRQNEIIQLIYTAFIGATGFFIEWITPGVTQLAIFIYFASK